jgi:uncharacterized membrane protein
MASDLSPDPDNPEDLEVEPAESDSDRLAPIPPIPPVVQEDIKDIRESTELIATAMSRSELWMGPLPPAERLSEYEEISSDIVPEIIADFVRHSKSLEASELRSSELEARELDIELREQDARIAGEQSDIRYRWISGVILWAVLLIVSIGALKMMWEIAENPSFSGAAGLLVVGAMVVILGVIVGGKGRLTQVESDTQVNSLNSVSKTFDAIRGRRKRGDNDASLPPAD